MARWKVLEGVIVIGCGHSCGLPVDDMLLADLIREQFLFEKQKVEQRGWRPIMRKLLETNVPCSSASATLQAASSGDGRR
jgi:hypothetical protein